MKTGTSPMGELFILLIPASVCESVCQEIKVLMESPFVITEVTM